MKDVIHSTLHGSVSLYFLNELENATINHALNSTLIIAHIE